MKALDRIGDEGQGLQIEANQIDGIRGDLFADRGHGQNRLAGVERLVGQAVLSRAPQFRHIVCRDDGANPGQRHGAAGVDAEDAGMRTLAEHQLAEQHAIGAKVLGVAGAAGDLGDDVRRDVVGADEPFCHLRLR